MTFADLGVSRETSLRIDRARALILTEASLQNLISASTIAHFDQRHIADSLQLDAHLPAGEIIDIGSGGGIPGLFLACCRDAQIHLVEPRAKRAAFLRIAVEALGFEDRVVVHQCKIERLDIPPVSGITARAVASLNNLFGMAAHLALPSTLWVLPKGRSAASELAHARLTWQGDFRLVPSVTDAEASIVLAQGVRRRTR